jgi:alkyl sulfatase BDS1-like metallo-beta-lactamase superfamily hydrolase
MKYVITTLSLLFVVIASYSQNLTSEKKEATDYTVKKNQALYAAYPFEDTMSFEAAKKGLIAPLPNNGIVLDKNGNASWDLKKFSDFIIENEKAPTSVNPSLWRQSQLLMVSGLFEVVPGVYQVRGADLSNMTIIEGDKGITIYDPLITAECSKYALDLYYAHRPKKPVVAVIYSHSHIDHFAGVRGIVDQKNIDNGSVKIYAPEGFLDHAIEENVLAGTAMSRRSSYMYGITLTPGKKSVVGSGLGVRTSQGTITLIAPTNTISKTGQKEVIDGIEYEFIMAPGSEAPSEMMWYLPKFKMINTAENAVHTMHNLYTLRGAKTRDAEKWPKYLNEVLQAWGEEADVSIGMHHWPVWGNAEIIGHIKSQRDTYKFIHDQTLHYANMGYTINELPSKVIIPESLVNKWGTHGYYGSKSHNVRAVYNFYLGYFDGNPAHLDPLTPVEAAGEYVNAMGGATKVLALGKKAYSDGKYKWGVELLNHLVFSDPTNVEAKLLQADMLEQLGYQTENGTWRNFYLTGAQELRQGTSVNNKKKGTASIDMMENMTLSLIFDYMGIQLDAKKANGKTITVNYEFTDIKENYTLFLDNSVLNYWTNSTVKNADVTIIMTRATFNKLLSKELNVKKAVELGEIKIKGDTTKFIEMMNCFDDLNQYINFNMVTP